MAKTPSPFCRPIKARKASKLPSTILTSAFGAEDDPAAQAHLLFDLLRECDERGAKEVYVRSPRTTGIGLAVYNRLLRAAAFQIVHLDESGVAAQ